ncbi:MAG TPA: DUF2235 domain-containing protein [Micromonosporaceae bacterium]|nr:DUF2235 domain-containing protein [Micromonosporaceae bacterium]
MTGKSIAVFSDGTGNSSAKLFKTNVWRTYQALDLTRHPPVGQPRQIAYYDNGVGTSTFRPLTLLGGILGVGLKRNVLDLYKFLCRNYHPGAGTKPVPGKPGSKTGCEACGRSDRGNRLCSTGTSTR